jgi:hypothetical protein
LSTIALKAGEAKTIRFTVTDADGDVVDLSSATLAFTVKKRKSSDISADITKVDGDFDKTQAASGIVDVDISSAESNLPAASYVAELKVTFSATCVDKSADITFTIEAAVA